MTFYICPLILPTKVIFFWDQSQDMSSSSFPPKKQASDWLTYLVYQSEACFFGDKPLADLDLRKNWL